MVNQLTPAQQDYVSSLTGAMKTNSNKWSSANAAERKTLTQRNEKIAAQISGIIGEKLLLDPNGVWRIGSVDGDKLYDKYKPMIVSTTSSDTDTDIKLITAQMQKNSVEWNTASPERRAELAKANEEDAQRISVLLGMPVTKNSNGVWLINGKTSLYDTYPSAFHKVFRASVSSNDIAMATSTGKTLVFNYNDGTGAIQVPTMSWMPSMNPPVLTNAQKSQKFPGIFYGDKNGGENQDYLLYMMNDCFLDGSDWYRFDRWYTVERDKDEVSGRHYIFVLRPDLNLTSGGKTLSLNMENGVGADTFFQYIASFHPQIIASLTGEFALQSTIASSGGTGNQTLTDGTKDKYNRPLQLHSYIPYLTSRIESLQLPDYTIKNYSLVQPYTRYSIPYASSAIESQTGGTFDLTLRDDGVFSIRKLFYAWIYYMDGVMRNRFQPKSKYILYNAFDYATSIYDIMVDATGENIIWWAKYTGCFPTNVPISDLSFNKGSQPDSKVSIPFCYYHYEPLDIGALVDLNYNSLGYEYMQKISAEHSQNYALIATKDSPLQPPVYTAAIYNGSVGYDGAFLGKNQVGRPVVFAKAPKGKNSPGFLKLRWLPMPNDNNR